MFVRTFVIPLYYSSGTVINYGSGSDFLTSYGSGSGSTRKKVKVPVPQHWKTVELDFVDKIPENIM